MLIGSRLASSDSWPANLTRPQTVGAFEIFLFCGGQRFAAPRFLEQFPRAVPVDFIPALSGAQRTDERAGQQQTDAKPNSGSLFHELSPNNEQQCAPDSDSSSPQPNLSATIMKPIL